MKKPATCLLLIFVCLSAFAGDPTNDGSKKQYFTQKIDNEQITLDGIPNEAAWSRVPWSEGYTQFTPDEGKNPAQQTTFKILYDDRFLYFGFRCYDAYPDSIDKRMGRRDEFPGDWVEVNIDSYHDLRSAFSFTLSVSGVKNDEFVSNNGDNWDPSWNPVWYAETHVDSLGWTAEMKIPFSQLRYGDNDEHVWGLQSMRRIFRHEERSTWQLIPQNSGVWVSGFGELRGLKGLKSQRQVEIQPYVLGQIETFEKQENNPFATGFDKRFTAGLDGKVAVTSDLMLDFTVNPDFGQVEADPSVVRLDGFRNFFEERRPFFIESRNIFNYQLTGSAAGGDYDSDLLFYSRKIGGSPHGYPALAANEYADVPENASILGAAKFSGKTRKGWSIGLLESVTAEERAEIDNNGERREEIVEPLTSYTVARLQKDIDEGNTIIGGIFTATNRSLHDTGLDFLHKSAYSGGVDFVRFWKNRNWQVSGRGIFSRVNGSPEAIASTQTAFEHLFQRPDADHLDYDADRTALSGHGGTFKIGRFGGKNTGKGIIKFETGATWRSPGLELNDIGFLQNADEINHFLWGGYQILQPFSIFRNVRFNYNHRSRWDFGGNYLYQDFNVNTHSILKNNWQFAVGVTYNPLEISNNQLRGGPALLRPDGMGTDFNITSDTRKKMYVSVGGFRAWGFDKTVGWKDISVTLRFQPLDALNFSVRPGYTEMFRRQDQFIDIQNYAGDPRYLVGKVQQRTLWLIARLNYNITPDLTVQYYGQPFISRGKFGSFGYVKDPKAAEYNDRFNVFDSQQIKVGDGVFSIDENRDGFEDYNFGQPDFNFVQFRSNLVVRWEYVPGSELYFVWSQNSTPNAGSDLDSPLVNSLFNNVFERKAQNIFLIKATYRFLL